MRLLVVEDDRRLSDVLRRGLAEQGHVVDVSYDGEDGERCASGAMYDAIVLDVNLPKRDGLSVVRTLRAQKIRTPVLILTSRDTPDDVIEGLDAGADDYLRKPFVFGELEARLRSIIRRGTVAQDVSSELRVADLVFDLRSRVAYRGERRIDLSARESAFVEYFMRNAGQLLTRRSIEDAIFDRESETTSNVVDVYASRLRSKLTARGEVQLLHTVRGAGYRFEAR
ncbi:MAG TPA: response regulator transcription factor [Candidatus Baltobacteraceae bacterium]|nr:response regulator transcription factor [Candidatus Baltobacteraceae bacterium]